MSIHQKIKTVREHGLFHDEKLVASAPVKIAPVPELPIWVAQPKQRETPSFCKPITIENPRNADIAACFLIALAFAVMSLL